MGTQNQAIGKSKGGMATKRLVVLPRGERPTPTTTSTTSPPLFQFALPRGERRAGCHGRGTVLQVSIRAPAWGATSDAGVTGLVNGVSIRAPAWGATIGGLKMLPNVAVSIRAPAWGATFVVCVCW